MAGLETRRRPRDDEDADEADEDGHPSPRPDPLAQQRPGGGSDDERAGEHDGGRLRQRQPTQGREVEGRRSQQQEAASDLEPMRPRADHLPVRPGPQCEQREDEVAEIAAPDDLQGREAFGAEELGGRVEQAKAQHGGAHQRDAGQAGATNDPMPPAPTAPECCLRAGIGARGRCLHVLSPVVGVRETFRRDVRIAWPSEGRNRATGPPIRPIGVR